MNKLMIDGRLGADPTPLKQVGAKNSDVCSFSLANSEYAGKDENGEAKYKTTWVRVTCWGYTARQAQSLKKGDLVVVSGSLEVKEYTNKDGEKKTSVEVPSAEFLAKTEKLAASARGEFSDWSDEQGEY